MECIIWPLAGGKNVVQIPNDSQKKGWMAFWEMFKSNLSLGMVEKKISKDPAVLEIVRSYAGVVKTKDLTSSSLKPPPPPRLRSY